MPDFFWDYWNCLIISFCYNNWKQWSDFFLYLRTESDELPICTSWILSNFLETNRNGLIRHSILFYTDFRNKVPLKFYLNMFPSDLVVEEWLNKRFCGTSTFHRTSIVTSYWIITENGTFAISINTSNNIVHIKWEKSSKTLVYLYSNFFLGGF